MGSPRKFGLADHFAMSGTFAIISKTACAPLDRIKLLMQTQGEIVQAGRLSEYYKGVIDCTVRTFRSEGILPFWRGNWPAILQYFPAQALGFAFKEKIKTFGRFNPTADDPKPVRFGKNIFAGSLAGVLTVSLVYTLDFARTRLAADVKTAAVGGSERQFKGLIDVYRKTFKSDGIVGLHRGFVIACVGITAYRGLYFGLYDSLKPLMLRENPSMIASLFLGFGTTMTSGLLCYPLDTVRRRMMMRSGEEVKYRGSVDCARHILRNEGFMALMRGASVSIVTGVAGALMFPVFDWYKAFYMRQHWKD